MQGLDGLGGDAKQDRLTDRVRIVPTVLAVDLINESVLGETQIAVAGVPYVAPLWELLRVLTRRGYSAANCVEDEGAFDLIVQ